MGKQITTCERDLGFDVVVQLDHETSKNNKEILLKLPEHFLEGGVSQHG